VYYKFLENKGQGERAERLDRPLDYLYPVIYLVSFAAVSVVFLL
jgi:hypothetical protein